MADQADQTFNLKFVAEVEKYPVLYNNKLKGHRKTDIRDELWSEIAEVVQLSVNDCKERWRNLRAVFVRHLKPLVNSNGKKLPPYYLAKAMAFILPYIKISGQPELSLSGTGADDPPHIYYDEYDPLLVNDTMPVSSTPASSISFDISPMIATDDDLLPTAQQISPGRKRMRNTSPDATRSVESIMKDSEEKKMFLLSLLPEVEPLTGSQMRSFRRKVLELIDDIRFSEGTVICTPRTENARVF